MEILSGRSIRATCSPKPASIPVGDLIGVILIAVQRIKNKAKTVSSLSQAMPGYATYLIATSADMWLPRGIWVPLLTSGGECPMTTCHMAVLTLQVQVAADMSVRGTRWQEQVAVNDWWQASKGSKSSCGDLGIAKSWITCVNTNRNTTLSEVQWVSLRHLWRESKCRNEMERGLAQMSVIVEVSHNLRDDSRNCVPCSLSWQESFYREGYHRLPSNIEQNLMFQRLGRYPTIVRVFHDPILFLAGLQSSWEHGQQRPTILVGSKEMAFRNFVYAKDEVDLSFLLKEPSLSFSIGSPSVSINIEPLRADEEPILQPAEVTTDYGGSPKPELFFVHPRSEAARIKDRKCKTRGGSSRPPVKRKLASGSSNSRATRAKTYTSKDDVPFLTVSDDDEGLFDIPELKDATACNLKISAITLPAWKNHLDNHMDVKLLDLHDRYYARQAVVDNVVNRRSRELLEVIEKLRGECNVIKERERAREEKSESLRVKCEVAMSDFEKNLTVIALREKISTLSTEVKEHKANLDRMMLESQKWESYQASLLTLESQIASLEVEKAWLEAVKVSLRKEADDVKRDRMEVVSKVVPYAAMELIHSDDLVAVIKEPFDLSKVKGYHPSYKKEHNQFGNDLATAIFPWLSEFVADPSAPVEVLLSRTFTPFIGLSSKDSRSSCLFLESHSIIYSRLPLTELFCEVLEYFQIYISRLNPFGCAKLTTIVVMCKAYGCVPTIELFRGFFNFCRGGKWLTFAKRPEKHIPHLFPKVITRIEGWKGRFVYVQNFIVPTKYLQLLLEQNKFDSKSYKDRLPPNIEQNPMFQRLGRYPTSVRVFHDPILFLAGLQSSWEHGQQRSKILMGSKGAFPWLWYWFPSVSINIEPLRADEEPVLQPAEVMTDFGRSPKPELFPSWHACSSAIFYGRCKAFERVAGIKEPFDLSKVKGYRPSYKKEHNQSGNDLATATFPWLSEFVADPSAPIEVLLSKKSSSLQRPDPSKTQALIASSPKSTPSSILGSNLMSPPIDASVVKPLSSQVE
ncbi:hypothetical protein Tco_0204197 [Tanacetum coccineum]